MKPKGKFVLCTENPYRTDAATGRKPTENRRKMKDKLRKRQKSKDPWPTEEDPVPKALPCSSSELGNGLPPRSPGKGEEGKAEHVGFDCVQIQKLSYN